MARRHFELAALQEDTNDGNHTFDITDDYVCQPEFPAPDSSSE